MDVMEEIISKIRKETWFVSICNSQDFYFEKARQLLIQWKELKLTDEQSKRLQNQKENYEALKFEFENGGELQRILDILFKIISYCDERAFKKNDLNEYSDKRILARAFVRMNNWIHHLILFKLDPDRLPDGSTKNAFKYLLDPQNNSTMLSYGHREQLCKKLLNKEYDEFNFSTDLKSHFQSYNIETVNKDNYTYLISSILYNSEIRESWLDNSNRNYYIIGSKYGDNNDEDVFPEMFDKSVVATGFAISYNLKDKLGKKQKDIVDHLKNLNEPANSYNCLKKFLNIKPGDLVAVKGSGSPKGSNAFLSIIGIGEVVDEKVYYEHDPSGLGHTIKVNWIAAPVYKEFEMGYGQTLHKLTNEEHIAEIFDADYEVVTQMGSLQKLDSKDSNAMTHPLNQILYGPPGTGKTYHTINKSIEICNPSFNLSQDRRSVKKEYDRLQKEGRIVFTTFHQSLSYEDFIEGLKPETKSGNITYEIKDGIFKELCKVASSKKNRSFSEAYDKLVSDLRDKTTIKIDLEDGKSFNITLLQNGEDLDVSGEVDLSTIKRKSLAYIASQKNKFGGKWAKPFKGIYRYLEKNYEYNPNDIENTIKPHVLIIDEINRGNVSQIFGELITLIEVDKRAGMKETIEVTLPYSGDPFSVPSNLYIIGTMNTADRSVEALDVALRRRFHFQEMMPNPDLVEPLRVLYLYWIKMYGKYGGSIDSYRKHEIDLWEMLGLTIVNEQAYVGFGDSLGSEASFDTFKETMRTLVQFEGGINFKELLEVINGRIKYLKDEDHQIGHSYLMNVFSKLELAETFNKNIIPLLKEYFYNDYGKIRLVLGDGFFTQVEEAPKMAVEDQNDFIGSMRYQLQEITAENIAEKLKLTLGV